MLGQNQLFMMKISAKIVNGLKIPLRRKKVHEVMSFDIEKYIYSENLFSTLYFEVKLKCYKKIS